MWVEYWISETCRKERDKKNFYVKYRRQICLTSFETYILSIMRITICLRTPAESTPESYLVQITPWWKAFGFFTFPTILNYLVHPRKYIESLIVPSEFLTFPQWLLILSLWYYSVLGVQQRVVGIKVIRANISPRILG